MELQEEVKIHGLDKEELAGRVFLSNGLLLADEPVDGFDYEDNTFKFKKPWRRPTNMELDKLISREEEPDPTKTVGIVKLPEELISEIENLGIPYLAHELEFLDMRKQKPREYLAVTGKIYQFKKKFLRDNSLFHKLKMAFFRYGWHTLALDVDGSRKFCGMHFDMWDARPLAESHLASNRMCLNLGKVARSFICINLTAQTVYDLTGATHLDPETRCQEELTYEFYKRFPGYPITRIELEPYEAYIAPTENIIHDGSSEEMSEIDINLTTRGFFNVYCKQATLV